MKRRYKVLSGIVLFLTISVTVLGLTIGYTAECKPASSDAGALNQMRAVIYRCYGSADVLEIERIEKPVPADDEVLVKIHAASVNPLDWHYMRGAPYIMRLQVGIGAPNDTSMGVDFAGTIESIGKSVTRFKIGDEVFGGRSGAFGEYVTVRQNGSITLKPANMTFAQAAAVPIAGITALQAVRDKGQIKAGQKVLINGASGGVGTFAVQIAKWLGAEVTGVCSTRNVEMVKALGADHVIDYKKDDYTMSGQEYDVIIDNVGNHSLLKNRGVLAPSGRFVIVGAPSGNWLGPLVGALSAPILSPFVEQDFVMILAQLVQDDLAILSDLMAAGDMTPVIDRHFDLDDISDAIRYSESGRARGKIIVDVAAN